MEELRSTEILDREIQEDARKKAEKILKLADIESKAFIDAVPARIDHFRQEKQKEYARRLDVVKHDHEASVPLEKQRRIIFFVDKTVNDALSSWFSSIDTEQQLFLLQKHAARYVPVLEKKHIKVFVFGYSENEIKKIVHTLFTKEAINSITSLSKAEAVLRNVSQGFILESFDGSIICRVTIEEIKNTLLSEKREELADKLLQGRLPNE